MVYLNTKFSPHKSRRIGFPCKHGLGDLQKLSAYSHDGSVTYFLDEQIEANRVYHLMQNSGVFYLEGISSCKMFAKICFSRIGSHSKA